MSLAGVVSLAALAAWMWVVGSALARGRPAAERVANGALAACVLAWTAMACGAFGIGILGSTAITACVALAAAVAALARRPPLRSARPVLAPLVVGGAAGLLLAGPGLLRSLDALRPSRNDMVWHMAWVHQLSAGFSSPGGVYAGEPNSYPWLFHSLVAWIAAALPGGAVDAFQVLELFGLVCAGVGMWLLARELGAYDPEATWSVGLFLTAAAFGLANRAAFQFEMPALELGPFHGDPVPAMTPALAYLPPMIPRDLGLALAPIVLWLEMCAARGPERMWWRAGVRRRAGLPGRSARGHLLRPVGGHDRGRRASLGDLAGGAGLGRGHLRLAGAAGDRLPPLPRVRADRAAAADGAEHDPDAGRCWPLVAAGGGGPRPARPTSSADGHPRDRAGRDPRNRRATGREHLATVDAGRARRPHAVGAMAALPAVPGAGAVRSRRRRGQRSRDGAVTTSTAAGHRRGSARDRRGRRLHGAGVSDGLARARPQRAGVLPAADRRPHTPGGGGPRSGCRLPGVDAVRTHRREPLRDGAAAGQGALPHVAA